MRVNVLATAVPIALVLAACGGPRDAQQAPPAAPPPVATPRATPPAAPRTRPAAPRPPAAPPAAARPGAGRVVEVRMTGNSRNQAAFEPARLSIGAGTTVRFINASGGPHNIVFRPEGIPRNARTGLTEAMPRHMGPLSSLMLAAPNETYEITFGAGLPKGVYHGYCQPHEKLGMVIAITLR
jgi:plastocyanin